ncbi:hypothetical protein SYNPS1DRAFT_32045 [Syncephalis pseudoplumigaleata]|uniref:Secreted protein n=1 Tax=Syncephalis pseudoplumigaleata TaxID=1712513 RepID=A0A4P9YTA9_9FUNG|nr:hypothetical protein SYNPS1DRAFT_32045 [Syncephalis pseudoplumigaleata]|eukprot:RKP22371.1 hypothetical protein SYNPS1DRAFT_32045 [Syncephalis pseudoplumigaleata]
MLHRTVLLLMVVAAVWCVVGLFNGAAGRHGGYAMATRGRMLRQCVQLREGWLVEVDMVAPAALIAAAAVEQAAAVEDIVGGKASAPTKRERENEARTDNWRSS